MPLFASELTLEQAECIALQNNQDIHTMVQLYEKSKQGRLESISKWLPVVSVISRGYKTQIKQTATNTRSAFISQFNLTQALFSTNNYYDVKISNLQVQYLKYLLDAIIIDVLYDVRTAYYKILLDFQNIDTAQTNIDLFSSLAERMQSDYNRGTSILLNVNQSKVVIANATSAYYQAIKQLNVDLDILATILGYNAGEVKIEFPNKKIPIETIPEIATKVNHVEQIFSEKKDLIYKPNFPQTEMALMQNLFSPQEIQGWEQIALCLRPELRSKCTEIQIAEKNVQKEKGTYLPNVSFEANYGGYPTYTQFDPSSGFFNQKFNWAVGFYLSWLIFDGWGRDYRINQARYERNAKKYEYCRGIQSAYEDVRRQIFLISESVANFVTSEGNVTLAEQTLDLAKKQLEIGYITIFDYQIVVDSLIQTFYIRDQARFDLIKAYYGLRHASGYDLKECK